MQQTWQNLKILGFVVLLLLAVHGVNVLLDGALLQFGIIPRVNKAWFHIFTEPFIHGSWQHLFNNIAGIIVFSVLCMARGIRFYLVASFFIIAFSGVLVWLFGRSAIHMGASGWVFGLWSLTISLAFFDRSFVSILTAVFVALFYGGMIYGVLPQDPRISFEAHLFGAAAGVFVAFVYGRSLKVNAQSNKVKNR